MSNKGLFITLEGGEGSGKSTQIKLLTAYLAKKNIPYLMTREPGGSPAAEEIRKVIITGGKEKWDSISETLLFFAARRNHLTETVWPAMKEGKWVVSDRYADSTMAYQGYGRGDHLLSKKDIDALYRLVAGDFKPDLTFILDIDPREGLKRAEKRGALDRMEGQDISFHDNLRAAYLDIAKNDPERCVVINASQAVEKVNEDMISVLKERFE